MSQIKSQNGKFTTKSKPIPYVDSFNEYEPFFEEFYGQRRYALASKFPLEPLKRPMPQRKDSESDLGDNSIE